ncbi:alpha/beta fold hydrolase [Pricia sp. S334]|uniref:Alpha/beta fold hydrolase n=1 Tax=Pricia mediterranea TaxID=3076079 RepID=A0ABU3LA72_9FLAO|nr:alpha/beta fold hydrolase [Pricia sp. S334]MDT7830463.1 alpha/beta fold hydrolase [Pricia sp. S334]
MKKATLFLLTVGITCSALAQEITGQWHGLLEIPGSPLRLVLNIEKSDSGYTTTLDSPDQGAKGIPVDTTTFTNGKLDLAATVLGLTYTAELVDDTLKGTFRQGGLTLPLEMSREAIEAPQRNRPQEPKEPFPYYTEAIRFKNPEADIELAGTLTLPKETGKYPVVVLISGSGPQDRNEELAGHRPFLVIADHLTRNGIGVLRFDDRGVGESTGDFKKATSPDFASDVESALDYLKTRKDIDTDHIGLIGHSEGGVVAPMVAAESDDVSFIVLMAGTGIPGSDILAMQGKLIEKAAGKSDADVERSAAIRKKIIDMTLASTDVQQLRDDLTNYLKGETDNAESQDLIPQGMDVDQFIKSQVDFMATPWMVYFLRHDPAKILENVECPVLAINGSKDLQVPAKENLSAIGDALEKAGNEEVTLIELPGLNHLFQESETGSPMEYGNIEQTFSPKALKTISDWIKEQTK